MSRRNIVQAAFIAVIGIICLGGASLARADQVTIKIWMHEHPPRLPIDKKIIAAFEKANPDIKVEYEAIAVTDYPTKLLTAFASGGGPDVFNAFSGFVAQYYNARILAPIDYAAMGYADQKALTSLYSSGFDGIRFAGKLYGVPTEVSNYACYTNNKLWKEAGLDPSKDFPKTWEALPAVAEKLTKRDSNGVPIRRGFDFDWPSRPVTWLSISSMMHQLSANLIDEASYKANLDSPAAQRSVQYWVDWANKWKLGGPQYTNSRTDFLGGKLATDCSFGVWGIPQMVDAKIDYTVKPAPRWADATHDNGFDAYAYYMMVNARSPAPVRKAAWKFVRMFTDDAAELFTGAGLFVPRKEVTDLPQFKTDPSVRVFLDELKRAEFTPRVVGYDQVVDAFLRGRDQMVQGGQPVAQVLPQVNQDINTILRREKAKAEAMAKSN